MLVKSRGAHAPNVRKPVKAKSGWAGKKVVIVAASAGLAVGMAGLASAYFSGTGTGTSHGNTGTATPFTVTAESVTGTLYPGATTSVVTFTVENKGHGREPLTVTTSAATVVSSSGGDIETATNSNAAVTGCKASWYSATTTAKTATLAKTTNTTVVVTVSMSNGTGTGSTQDPCENKHPLVHLHIAS